MITSSPAKRPRMSTYSARRSPGTPSPKREAGGMVKKMYDCPHCDETQMSAYSFLSHATVHTDIFKYVCFKCGKGVNHLGNARKHAYEVHSLKPHQVLIKDMENPAWDKSVRELYASVPDFSMSARIQYIKPEPSSPSAKLSRRSTGQKKSPYKPLKEEKTPVKPGHNNMLITRTGGVAPNALVQCELCKDRVQKANLARHITAKHPEVNRGPGSGLSICSICYKTFSKASDMRIHYRQVHEPSKKNDYVRCDICQDILTKMNLSRHIQMKHPEAYVLPPNKCPECDRRFKAIGPLTRHLAEFHNIKPDNKYSECKFCSEFMHKGNMARHLMEKHPDNRTTPLECPECGVSYATQGMLNRHRGNVHGKWPEICQANISSLGMESWDTKISHDEEPADEVGTEAVENDVANGHMNGEHQVDLFLNGAIEQVKAAGLESDAASFVMSDIKSEPVSETGGTDSAEGEEIENSQEQRYE